MPGTSTSGWLPVEIAFDPQPAVISEAMVSWLEFGSAPLAEPFLERTVARLRQATPPAREITTDLETMVRVSGRLPAIRPAGFIFHISRSGSTLIANALKTADRAVVVSESVPVTTLLRPYSDSAGPYLSARWNRSRRTLLESLFSLYACYRTGEPEPLVIKFVSINILCMAVVRSYWPEVPCVVVVRDPVEVMVASLEGGGWMNLKASPELAREFFGWESSPEEMSDEEFSARVLGRYFACALEAVDAKCMVIDYEDLNARRIQDIASFFAIELPSGAKSLERVFRVYAKDPGNRQFRDDRARKQQRASASVRSAAREWVMGPYHELRGRIL